MRAVIAVDAAVGLDHPLVALGGVGREHVALDQRLGELGLQRARAAPSAPATSAEGSTMLWSRRKSASRSRTARRFASASASSSRAKRTASSRACSESCVHQRARLSARIARGDRLGVLGREGVGAHVDDAGGAVVADLDHAPPVAEQRLDRGRVAEGEDRVALGAVVDRAQVELGVDRLDDLLAADVLEEDVGVRGGAGADLGQRPEQPGRRRAELLGADREGDLGMVLVGGAGPEIAGGGGEAAASTSSTKLASIIQCRGCMAARRTSGAGAGAGAGAASGAISAAGSA